jgi:hypothetical protein
MLSLHTGVAKRRIASPKSPLLLSALCVLLAGAALSGCVYDPYYAVYDPAPLALPYHYPYGYRYPYGYGRPAYVGPPITFNFGYSHYSHHSHGTYGGHGGPGWRRHGRGGGHGGGHGHR